MGTAIPERASSGERLPSSGASVSRRWFVRATSFLTAIYGLKAMTSPVPAVAAPDTFQPRWVVTVRPTNLWSGSASHAVGYGLIGSNSALLVVSPQQGTLLFVYVPWTRNYAFVDAEDVAAT